MYKASSQTVGFINVIVLTKNYSFIPCAKETHASRRVTFK